LAYTVLHTYGPLISQVLSIFSSSIDAKRANLQHSTKLASANNTDLYWTARNVPFRQLFCKKRHDYSMFVLLVEVTYCSFGLISTDGISYEMGGMENRKSTGVGFISQVKRQSKF
jgi:hypothetical protein